MKWADRQFRLNPHTVNKIASGATRNIVIRSAVSKGLLEDTIRADMEHIHNLVIISVTIVGEDAYVSMNSIHNALFARTCMMSRSGYKGCKIEFYPDECDVPLPVRTHVPKISSVQQKAKLKVPTNRFGMLDLDGNDDDSDEENRTPSDDEDSESGDDTVHAGAGVSLNFLDADGI